MSKKPAKYICPFCFGTVSMDRIHYVCADTACTLKFLEKANDAEKRRYVSDAHPGQEVDVERSLYMDLDPRGPEAVATSHHISRNSRDGRCEICGQPAYLRLCPICHNPIPPDAEENGSSIYVVLGSARTGKSHYLAVLVNTLMHSFSAEFGTELKPASQRTVSKYQNCYYKRLFQDGMELEPTPSYDTDRQSREPMIYYLSHGEGEERKTHTLALFDTAGSDLDSTNKLMSLNIGSFIAGAGGIVFLIDPLQVKAINERLRVDGKPVPADDTEDRLRYIADLVRMKNKLRPGKKIDVPLAVVLTKVDLLMKVPENDEEDRIVFGPESSLHVEREKGVFDRVNMNEVSAEVEEYLRRTVGQGFVDTVNAFSDHEYFAVSALGKSPVNGAVPKGISPFRVEDPFIWLLMGGARRN
ncbi:hypothetical protein TALC_00733 [Thermoplasmatales archaeon BRNA1]|nr:hypothetical protein TALC_00733 [Thermoplasmatales archaeon BRNA1]